MRARQYETTAYRDFLYEAMEGGTEWIAAPRPRLLDESYQLEDLSIPTLVNKEIVFDAPNIVRLGKDLLYQVSNSGTKLGYEWLKTIVEPKRLQVASWKLLQLSTLTAQLFKVWACIVLTEIESDFYPRI